MPDFVRHPASLSRMEHLEQFGCACTHIFCVLSLRLSLTLPVRAIVSKGLVGSCLIVLLKTRLIGTSRSLSLCDTDTRDK